MAATEAEPIPEADAKVLITIATLAMLLGGTRIFSLTEESQKFTFISMMSRFALFHPPLLITMSTTAT